MKKGLVVVVGILILLLPFVSAKAFTWTISAVNLSYVDVAVQEGALWKAPLNSAVNISSTWAWGWKNTRSCKTSFIQELWNNNAQVAVMHCNSDTGCVKRGPDTGWAPIQGAEWITEGCVQYCKGGCMVGPSNPSPDAAVVADLIVARLCYADCSGWGGGVSKFEYDQLIDRKDMSGNVVVDDRVKDITPDGLGAIMDINHANTVRIKLHTDGVMLWIGGEEDYAQTSTDDLTSHVYVCTDFDKNNICDGLQPDAIACTASYNGSYFKGFCCGHDVGCGYVENITKPITVHIVRDGDGNIQQLSATPITSGWGGTTVISTAVNITPVYVKRDTSNNIVSIRDTPATGYSAVEATSVGRHCVTGGYPTSRTTCVWRIPPLAGDTTVSIGTFYDLHAYCGNNSEGKWEWAAVEDVGEIHHLANCPQSSIVSDGTTLFGCGAPVEGINPISDFLAVTVGQTTHEYMCRDNGLTECEGSRGAFSTKSTAFTGAQQTLSSTVYYCASDGDWTKDLDIKDDESCEAAGFSWTGSRCCSEADDTSEYYNDPKFPNATGGCWNKMFVRAGEFAVTDRILNYKGKFFGCRLSLINDAILLNIKDYHLDNLLIDNSITPCGAVLMDAQPGGMPHAKCQPNGEWMFTDEPGGVINKSIKWAGLVGPGIALSGCCALDQCWNGTKCQKLGTYYRLGEEGFICKMLPPTSTPEPPTSEICHHNNDCPTGQYCADQECISGSLPDTCANNNACPSGYHCQQHACVEEPV